MKSRSVFQRFACGFLVSLSIPLTFAQDQAREQREAEKYYDKWLNQDVLYIVTDDERAVFEKLTTLDEKDQFIEQFWQRRDLDPSSGANEFKEEHYRRIAHANSSFGSGIPGWKTDRGRIYILYGEPDEIEHNTGGGTYVRKAYEGGGRTATFPFEVWRYRHLEGVGQDIELEFVDRSWSGEYKLAENSWDKDLALRVDGLGFTQAERLGMLNRAQHPGLHPGNRNNTLFQKKYMGARAQDAPFERMLRYYSLQRPPEIRQKELKGLVESHVSFELLPFRAVTHPVWISPSVALVPLTLEVPNRNLSYVPSGTVYKARVGIYGRVTSLGGTIVTEFEERLASEYKAPHLAVGMTQSSLYQRTFSVPPGAYKVELVVKDIQSGKIGTLSRSVHLHPLTEETLTAGPIILAKQLQRLSAFPEAPQSFVIGDVRVVPNLGHEFRPTDPLGVYLQAYNHGLDAATNRPAVTVEFEISRDGEVVSRLQDKVGSSIGYASEQRLVLMRTLKLEGLQSGWYRLTVRVRDLITAQTTSSDVEFQIIEVAS